MTNTAQQRAERYTHLMELEPEAVANMLVQTEVNLSTAHTELGKLSNKVKGLELQVAHLTRSLRESQPVTDEMVEDFAVTAIESGNYGIGYWVDQVRGCYWAPRDAKVVSNEVPLRAGGKIQLRLTEDVSESFPAGTVLTVSKASLVSAIQQYASLRSMTTQQLHDNHDSQDADSIFQLAVFDQIILG